MDDEIEAVGRARGSIARRCAVTAVIVVMLAGCGTTDPSVSTAPVSPTASSAAVSPVPVSPVPASSGDPGPPIALDELSGKLAFSFDDGVWVSDADGQQRRPLTHDGGFDPTFSPDGTQIAYRLLLAADDGEIWLMDADGANQRNLVNDPDFSDWGPAWSPDGRLIAYDSNRTVGLAVWFMDADGSDRHIVTDGHGEYPTWSPDGKRIAYAGGSYYDIRVADADGSNDRALTSTAAYDMGPAWSPDGEWIAYHTQVDYFPDLGESGMGPEMEIHLVRPDGSDDHRITSDMVEDSFPAWSPDGRYLVWSRHGELVVARPDGSGMVNVGSGNFPSWVP
jgi:Tol biopolymer transport system component